MAELFTLTQGRWYAMTMYPGYTDEPYRSPIELHCIHPSGNHQFLLEFWNVGYAAGVQSMRKSFRTLQRSAGSLIAQETEMQKRIFIFERLTGAWIGAFTPMFSTTLVQAIERGQVFSAHQKPRDNI